MNRKREKVSKPNAIEFYVRRTDRTSSHFHCEGTGNHGCRLFVGRLVVIYPDAHCVSADHLEGVS